MNLDNLNLVELNAQEVQEVDGGFILQLMIEHPGAVMEFVGGVIEGFRQYR